MLWHNANLMGFVLKMMASVLKSRLLVVDTAWCARRAVAIGHVDMPVTTSEHNDDQVIRERSYTANCNIDAIFLLKSHFSGDMSTSFLYF